MKKLRATLANTMTDLYHLSLVRFGSRLSPRSMSEKKWKQAVSPKEFQLYLSRFSKYEELENFVANEDGERNKWLLYLPLIRQARQHCTATIRLIEDVLKAHLYQDGLIQFCFK